MFNRIVLLIYILVVVVISSWQLYKGEISNFHYNVPILLILILINLTRILDRLNENKKVSQTFTRR